MTEPRCGAEQNTVNLPPNNPPHVCVVKDTPDHVLDRPGRPATPHEDYSGYQWWNAEPQHRWVIP